MARASWALAVGLLPAVLGGCESAPDDLLVRSDDAANLRLAAGESIIEFHTPDGLDLHDIAVGALSTVDLRDRSVVEGDIASTNRIMIGNDVDVGDGTAGGDISVGWRAHTGDLTAGGAITVAHTATTGSLSSHASLDSDGHLELAYDVPDSSFGHVMLNWGQSDTLVPGRYDNVILNSGATLKLSSGVYFMDMFLLNNGADVEFEDDDGHVTIYVADQMASRGNWHDLGDSSDSQLLVVYTGSGQAVFETPFDGFVIAPYGTVRMAGNDITHEGAFFGKHVEISPTVTIDHRPFAGDDFEPPEQHEFKPIDPDNAPTPDDHQFVKDRTKLGELGKALFWDIQVGTDLQACASCHYNSGADVRVKNQISPGLLDLSGDPVTFDAMASGPGGPNFTLHHDDFPLRKLSDPSDRKSSVIHHAGNDTVSSLGTLRADIVQSFIGTDECVPVSDPIFTLDGDNTRRVEPRNTPTMVNAVFNFRNFWDGRANNVFNGMDPFGRRNPTNTILKASGSSLVSATVDIRDASLASQAVGPPLSDVEMNCGTGNASFPRLGRRILDLYALQLQDVHASDSVLASLRDPTGGLTMTYRQLIEAAFADEYWDSSELTSEGFSLIENNFSLFFGLAVMEYERSLISKDSDFDKWAGGDYSALTEQEKRGAKLFDGKGKCTACHNGPELGAGSDLFKEHEEGGLVERMPMSVGVALYDNGFYNIGVTPTVEDIGTGANDPWGNPLSFSRQEKERAAGMSVHDPFETDPSTFEVDPHVPVSATERDAVDGSFKTPQLRNLTLTGPFFHNGGQATLRQVVEFYNRGGDRLSTNSDDSCDNSGFDSNCTNLDPDITTLGMSESEIDDMVAFLESLTDPKVSNEEGVFSHPSLPIVVGHVGDETWCDGNIYSVCSDETVTLPAIGSSGRSAEGLPSLPSFDEMLDCVNGDPNASVPCFQAEYGAY